MTKIEELLMEIPYSVGISKLCPKDKMIDIVDNYRVQLVSYSSGVWHEIKDFYGNDLQALLEETLNWCNGNSTKEHINSATKENTL